MERNENRPRRRRETARPYRRTDGHYGRTVRERSRRKRILTIAAAVLCVLFVGAGAASAAYYFHISDQLNRGDKSQEELDALDEVLETTAFDEPFYLMLIGSDARSDDPSMGARSDTNVVVRVDAPAGQLTLVSIPRDTRVQIDGHGTNKFNAAYAFGRAAGAIDAAEELLDIDISHYAEVNFESLVDLVDAVGGVDVEVEETIDDPKADLDYSTHHSVIEEGLQHLDGLDALAFARSRAFASGDFARASHQRQLIEAIIEKVLSAPVTQMPDIIEKASKCVTTDLSITDLLTLARMFKDSESITIYSAGLPSEAAMIGGVSYVINNEAATKAMMELVEAGKDPATLDEDDYPMQSYASDEDALDESGSIDDELYDPAFNENPYSSHSPEDYLYGSDDGIIGDSGEDDSEEDGRRPPSSSSSSLQDTDDPYGTSFYEDERSSF